MKTPLAVMWELASEGGRTGVKATDDIDLDDGGSH